MKSFVIASGGFDPIHVGHVKYLEESLRLGQHLIVIVNSDDFLIRKKGFVFMNEIERCQIILRLRGVWMVVISKDDDLSVSNTLRGIKKSIKESMNDLYPGDEFEIIFAKGGDAHGRRESKVCEELGIKIIDNVGGGKQQSSSNLLREFLKNRPPEFDYGEK